MKARLLRKILNDTEFRLSNNKDYIAVGSTLCHDIISVNKKTLEVKYALDTFNEGRNSLAKRESQKELLFIWDKLHELIDNGDIHDIINGKDIIENPLPVFTFDNDEIIESVTDFYGYPNTDDNGICMYDNTHFQTEKEAIEYGISELGAGIETSLRRITQLEEELLNINKRLEKDWITINSLKKKTQLKMKIESKDNQTIIKEVYNSITLETKEGKQLHICMRDFGFEMKIDDGDWHLITKESDFVKSN